MKKIFFLMLFSSGLLTSGCAVNPVSGKSNFVLISEKKAIEIGRSNHPEIVKQFGLYEDKALQTYVQKVGERIAEKSHRSELIYRFTVLDSTQVNAFALPGGYIYITRGLMAYLNSEAELAAVLGHEIGHVTARHSVRQITAARTAQLGYILGSVFVPELNTDIGKNLFNVIGSALISGYGREYELEADRLGSEYLARSGYDPQAMIEVIGVLKDQETFEKQLAKEENREANVYHGVFASHPDNDTRLQEVVANAAQFKVAGKTVVRQMRYMQAIDNLVFGDGEQDGIRRGNHFYHREFGIAIFFPRGWIIDNLPDQVLARTKDSTAVIRVTAEDLNRRLSPSAFLKTRLRLPELSHVQVLETHGLEGATGLASVKTAFGKRRARISVIYYNNRAFIFIGAAKEDTSPLPFDKEFLGTARSMHPLKENETMLAKALRLKLLKVGAGVSFKQLAAQSAISDHAEEQLRLLNHFFPKGEPQPGQWLKIVE